MTLVAPVFAAIDAANAADPTQEDGQPAALLHGRRMSETLDGFRPDASDPLAIACRGRRVERWTRTRADWPEGRKGCLDWRMALKAFHAERVAGFMADAGWPQPDRDRVATLIRKEGDMRDPEAQALEDVACLVFMRWRLPDVAERRPRDQVIEIAAETCRKMSAEGRAAALRLPLPDDVAALMAA